MFSGQEHEVGRFDKAVRNARKYQMKVVRTSAALVPSIQPLVATAIAVLINLAMKESANGAMSRGEFVAFITATGLLIPPIKRLASANEFLQRGIAAAKSVFSLIDSPKERDFGSISPSVKGQLSFKNIFFTYEENEILRNISLEIQPGEMVAFVGPSGGGKTTLLNLVPRLYEPISGEIFLDSKPITDYSLVNLRKNISYVAQNIILFNDTIRNNIAYGFGQAASDDDIERVADLAQLGECEWFAKRS